MSVVSYDTSDKSSYICDVNVTQQADNYTFDGKKPRVNKKSPKRIFASIFL